MLILSSVFDRFLLLFGVCVCVCLFISGGLCFGGFGFVWVLEGLG